jgi:hypothetical protein
MMRAIGHWAAKTDESARREWWNLIEQNGKTLYGDGFILPKMDVVQAQVPAGTEREQVVILIQNLVEIQRAKG